MGEHLPASEHLNENEWLELILGGDAAAPRRHLDACAHCSAEFEKLRASLQEFRSEAHQAAERPEGFWARQHAATVSRALRKNTAPRLAWAASLAAVVLAALILANPAPRAPSVQGALPAPSAIAASAPPSIEGDAALLMDVQQSVQRDVPEALEPAALLVDEMNQRQQQHRNP